MGLTNQRGQTGIAVLALIVALVALALSVYTYLQMERTANIQSQLTRLQELSERGRQEMADALKRLEELVRGRQPGESPPRQ
ncbi:MAG TPA: hypothetical protein VNP04_09445 [Alphaproteobacteria bacterium]|nr:hypothetical protein [Alphaproteobacteria bacterium]